jgi:hypothetical protein
MKNVNVNIVAMPQLQIGSDQMFRLTMPYVTLTKWYN